MGRTARPGTRIDMTGETVVVTGASSGFGAAPARRLAAQGADVIPVGRSPVRTARVAAGTGAEPLVADYADLAQVRRLARDLLERRDRIDVRGGHHAHRCLSGALLQPRQQQRDPHIQAFSVHPDPGVRGPRGPESTYPRFASESRLAPLFDRFPLRRFRITAEDGAEPLIWLASAGEIPAPNGTYFHGFTPGKVNPQAKDPELAERLWTSPPAWSTARPSRSRDDPPVKDVPPFAR
ncbi:SDR family NAD(P)-dependent oxidoreductase [Actinomadura sp. LD22]|uniref:SDR family NAD(P)-dependent oxidoreductase n=1 Tax=Actinomadura physcomitrii TaxID=2650748 RepID=A0A6I4MJ63_9ACTN|nr:SDR family NAD(P)-dependent oxidoreductase [Actinomadura physcomitrii]MWA02659.1 SDR family NAD(P)-dependent oxidoreductase [Actinomadura physcomitrii]